MHAVGLLESALDINECLGSVAFGGSPFSHWLHLRARAPGSFNVPGNFQLAGFVVEKFAPQCDGRHEPKGGHISLRPCPGCLS